MSTLQVCLLPVLAALTVVVSPAAAQNKLVNDLAYALPLPVVSVILIVIGIVIFCVMRRARYGYFCCIKPRVIYLPDPPSSENSDGDEEAESGSANQNNTEETSLQAPGYSTHPNSTIAPPDYQDALQDVLVVPSEEPPAYANNEGNETEGSGESTNQGPESSSEQPPDHQPEESSNQQPQEQEEQQRQELELEEVDLDDDSTESCDDTTPLNP